ncbi:MAG: hypothetical protein ACLFU7_10300 [Armatimonadota bacterium]
MSAHTAIRLSAVIVCVAAIAIPAVAADAPAAIVTVEPPRDRVLSGQFEGRTGREIRANFGFGPTAYAIAHKYRFLTDDPDSYEMGEGYIGMPSPCSCNWYHSGFLFIRINGRDVPIPASSMMAVESGERAIMDLVWHHEDADVRARFFGLPGEDWLGCEIAIDPTGEIEQLGVNLRCYPSFFTSHHKREGARRIQTPSALVEEGTPAEGPLGDHWWGVYYDEVFDVARGEGEGPCAMLAVPVEGATVSFDPGGYAVGTSMSFPPETRTIRLAFWDLKGTTNEDALANVRAQAEGVRSTLETIDLTPAAVTQFDVASVRESLRVALESEETREALGDRIDEIQQWMEGTAPELEQTDGAPGIRAQDDLLKSIDDYNSFKWQVKLTKLLSDL